MLMLWCDLFMQNMLIILYYPCVEWKTCEGYIEINWLNLGGYEYCNYWLNVSRCYMNAYWSVGVELDAYYSDDTMKLIVNDHDWWCMEEMYIDCGIKRLTVID